MATCDFTPVPCPKECKQNDTIQRKNLEKHLKEQCINREYQCNHCGKKDTFTNITGIHNDVCEKKVLPCPNADCPDSMQRAEIKQHLENDCEHSVISCKYMYEGLRCDVKMKRKDMRAHEQAHLHQAVVKLQDNLLSATENIASLKEESDKMTVQLRKEIEEMAAELRRESNNMAVMATKSRRESEHVSYRSRKGFLILLCICFLLSYFYSYNEKKVNDVAVKLNMVIVQQKYEPTKRTFKTEKKNPFF